MDLIDNARALRKRSTDAERLLWQRLRHRQLGVRFRRQHPVAGFILDFYCAEAQLGIELDGGEHAREGTRDYDEHRERILAGRGIRLLRFWNPEVLLQLDAVMETIWHHLRSPPPCPPPAGAGRGF